MFDKVFTSVFEYTIDVLNYIYNVPFVKNISKKSIIGNYINKTVEYYINSEIDISPLDGEYVIKYVHDKKDYYIVCYKDSYKEAVSFIKKRYLLKSKSKILYAYEKTDSGNIDITEKVIMYSGPQQDFYINTDFYLPKNYITENDIFIVTLDSCIHIKANEEIIL